jgi:hypothetical protein
VELQLIKKLTKYNNQIYRAAAIICGLVFLTSGILKSLDLGYFANSFSQYQLNSFRFLAPIITILEVYIGIQLFLLIQIRRNSLIGSILILSFSVVLIYGYLVHESDSCNCFGSLIPYFFNSIEVSLVRNLILFLLLLYAYFNSRNFISESPEWKVAIVSIILLSSVFLAGSTSGLELRYSPNKLNPSNPPSIDQLQKYMTHLEDSTSILFFFSYSCPSCLNSIANLNEIVDRQVVNEVIGIATGTDTDKEIFYRNFQLEFKTISISLEEMSIVTPRVPYTIIVSGNEIVEALRGTVPSAYYIRKIINENHNIVK